MQKIVIIALAWNCQANWQYSNSIQLVNLDKYISLNNVVENRIDWLTKFLIMDKAVCG